MYHINLIIDEELSSVFYVLHWFATQYLLCHQFFKRSNTQVSNASSSSLLHNNSRYNSPDVSSVIILSSRQEVRLHHLLGVVGWYLPDRGVGVVSSAGKLEVQVSSAAVHLQHLDGGGVRVVHLDHRVVARVQWQLDAHQRLDPIRIRRSRPSHIVSEASRTRVNIERILHDARLPTKKHHVKGCISSRRYYLR